MTDTPDQEPQPLEERLLQQLEENYWPRQSRTQRQALRFWTPPKKVYSLVRVPTWSWEHPDYPKHDPSDLITLDCNGAYIAAIGQRKWMALSGLSHTGPMAFDKLTPGWWCIDAHPWQDSRLCSPLGTGTIGYSGRIWVPTPTVELLEELNREGMWPEIRVHDSWTAWHTRDGSTTLERCELADWQKYLKLRREQVLTTGTDDQRARFKNGYGAAFALLAGMQEGKDRRSPIRRPDWWTTVLAAHSANQWRKMWRATLAGVTVLRASRTDAFAITPDDLDLLVKLQDEPRPPLKLEFKGLALGAFKVAPPEDEDPEGEE